MHPIGWLELLAQAVLDARATRCARLQKYLGGRSCIWLSAVFREYTFPNFL